MDKKFWNKKCKNMTPYIPGEQPVENLIKLNTNENPYPPSDALKKAASSFDCDMLRKYPDPSCSVFKDSVSGYYGVGTEMIFAGNGSDEVLAFAFQAFFDKNTPVSFPDVTYSFYPVYSDMFEVPYNEVPVKENLGIDLMDYKDLEGGVIIANPNTPTGSYLELDVIKDLIRSNRNRLFIVDEAYIDFGGESCVCLVEEFDNLLVVQTLSKSRALAGLRVGYAIGSPSLVKALECVRDSINSYTLDSQAQFIGSKAFEDKRWFEEKRAKIIETRGNFTESLSSLGFNTIPSMSNFVFTSHPEKKAKTLYELLRKKGILVRYFEQKKLEKFLRITIGTPEDMEKVKEAFEKILCEENPL